MSRVELVVRRGPTGSFGIALNDANVVTNVGADSELDRLDVIIAVDGESIVGERLANKVPMFGDLELTVLRPNEGVTEDQLERALSAARRGVLLLPKDLRRGSDSPASESDE